MKKDNNLGNDQINARIILLVLAVIVAGIFGVIFYSIGFYNGKGVNNGNAIERVATENDISVIDNEGNNPATGEVVSPDCPTVPTPNPDFCPGGMIETVTLGNCVSGYRCVNEISAAACSQEGIAMVWHDAANLRCCPGLTSVFDCSSADNCSKSANVVCVNCGDGKCGAGENGFNCPLDCAVASCAKEGEYFYDEADVVCCPGLHLKMGSGCKTEVCPAVVEYTCGK